MFFKKKTKKLDPKVRFQHKQFTGKLKAASSYKRQVQAVPESTVDKVLAMIGLQSRWSQAVVVVLLLAGIYIVYIPNFLFVKNIVITGLSDQQVEQLSDQIWREVDDSIFIYPQKNLIFFQPQLVQNAVLKIPSINKTVSIKRDFKTQTLSIDAESKYERFLITTPDRVYDVYNDGLTARTSVITPDEWPQIDNPKMLKLQLHSSIQPKDYERVFDVDLLNFLNSLSNQLSELDNLKIRYYQLKEPAKINAVVSLEEDVDLEEPADAVSDPSDSTKEPEPILILPLPIASPEVQVVIQNNQNQNSSFRIIFDATGDPASAIKNLKLLFSNLSPERYNNLSYIDMRVPEKAFLCLHNSPCGQ